MSASRGTFCWYELMTSDTEAAKAFYGKVMGWSFEKSAAPSGIEYTRLKVGNRPMGGLMALPEEACKEGARPAWIGYIQVDDVDGFADRIAAKGGKVHKAPADIPSVGRFAVVSDPQGGHFVLFKPASGAAPEPVPFMTPGHGAWHELNAAEPESAFAFYRDMFGWTKGEAFDMGPIGTYQLFATGANPVGGIMKKMDVFPVSFWLYYFAAENIDAAMKRVNDAGGKVLNGPAEVPGGAWIIQCLDPQGAMFAIVAPPGRH
jgi:predicted enzyme related to lactoylglutathione lyase